MFSKGFIPKGKMVLKEFDPKTPKKYSVNDNVINNYLSNSNVRIVINHEYFLKLKTK